MIASMETVSPVSTAPPVTVHKLLTGQRALVTGANSGIGKGVAIALGQAGADVVVNYVEGDDAANDVVDEIRKSGVRAYAYKADVSAEDQVEAHVRADDAGIRHHRHSREQCRLAARTRHSTK